MNQKLKNEFMAWSYYSLKSFTGLLVCILWSSCSSLPNNERDVFRFGKSKKLGEARFGHTEIGTAIPPSAFAVQFVLVGDKNLGRPEIDVLKFIDSRGRPCSHDSKSALSKASGWLKDIPLNAHREAWVWRPGGCMKNIDGNGILILKKKDAGLFHVYLVYFDSLLQVPL